MLRSDSADKKWTELAEPIRHMKFMEIILRHSDLPSKNTQRVSKTNISWLICFKTVTAVYSENHTNNTVGKM
jgi:hypothetical protein